MRINHNNRSIIINDSQHQYSSDIKKYFDEYFDAIDTASNTLDFSIPKQFLLKEWGWKVWLPSFTESIKELHKYLKYLNIKPNDIVIDAGGFAGITSMLFANAVGKDGTVITIEADPTNIQCIKKNFEKYKSLYDYSPTLIEGALWDTDGLINFSAEGAMGSAAVEYVGVRGNNINVNTYSLTTIAKEYTTINHMKIDIEGAELRIFNDEKFFNQHHPSLVIECHFPNIATSILKPKLESYGYTVKIVSQAGSPFEMIVAN